MTNRKLFVLLVLAVGCYQAHSEDQLPPVAAGAEQAAAPGNLSPLALKRLWFPPAPGVTVQTYCGEPDLQQVESYRGNLGVSIDYVRRFEPSTVQLQWLPTAAIQQRLPGYNPGTVGAVRWCTGTLISDRLVLTAGHCVEPQSNADYQTPYKNDANGNPVLAPPEKLATLLQVVFGYQIDPATGAPRSETRFGIAALKEHSAAEGGLDYAIVELSPAGGHYPTVTPVKALTRAPADGEVIAIIQHPDGQTKQIEAGHVRDTDHSQVFYADVDTLGGTSGAGVRDSSGNLIAVHTQGGCALHGGANSGVSTQAISAVSAFF